MQQKNIFTKNYALDRQIWCVFVACIFQVVPMKFDPRDEDSIKAVMAKANVVINLIGDILLSILIFSSKYS
jgi:hypothetical protein